jgi:galactose-1-phosphate uridylyltransferase
MKKRVNPYSKKIPVINGHWGIFKEVESVPEERWDPFRTIIENEVKIGHNTIINTLRGEKPYEYLLQEKNIQVSELKEGKDSFCRLIAGEIPSIVLSKDLGIVKDPFSDIPEYENLTSTKVFSAINLYPPIPRIFQKFNLINKTTKKNFRGIPLIHVVKNHYRTIEEVSDDEMILLLQNIILTVKASQEALLVTGRNGKTTVFQFFNIGSTAGASIPHLHAQTYLFNDKKGYGWKNKGFKEVYRNHQILTGSNKYCLGCEYHKKIDKDPLGQEIHVEDRVTWEDENWIGFTSFAPERDCHLRLLPKRHVSSLWNLKSFEIKSLAKGLIVLNNQLSLFVKKYGKELNIQMDRNILIRQAHFGDDNDFHMLIDIIPIQQIGGVEMLDDLRLSQTFPEVVAHHIRILTAKTKID